MGGRGESAGRGTGVKYWKGEEVRELFFTRRKSARNIADWETRVRKRGHAQTVLGTLGKTVSTVKGEGKLPSGGELNALRVRLRGTNT